MIATVPEMYRWVLALEDTSVLPAAARAKMFQRWPKEGYGWHVETDRRGIPLIHKGGGMPQYASQILHYPTPRLVIIWATNNLQQRWRQALNQGLTAAALGERVDLPPPVTRTRAEQLGRYQSRCSTEAGASVTVHADSGFLYLSGDRRTWSDGPYYPVGRDAFAAFDPRERTLTRLRFNSSAGTLVLGSEEKGRNTRLSARCEKDHRG